MIISNDYTPDKNITANKNLELLGFAVIKEIYPLIKKDYINNINKLKKIINEYKELKIKLKEYKNTIEELNSYSTLLEKQIIFIDRFYKATQLEILDKNIDKLIFDKIDNINLLTKEEIDKINSKLFQILMDRIH